MKRYVLVALAVLASATYLSAQSKPTIVLVHGAWADASGWYDVTRALQAHGYKVVAVQNSLFSYAEDNETTNRVNDPQQWPPLVVAPAWKTVPSWYVLGTQDRAINPELERFMAKRMNAHVTEVPTGHLSYIARPQDVARVIESASQ